MIKSMTGYGRGKYEGANARFTVEIKTVNHRYCDISLRMHREIMPLEERAKKTIAKFVSRGRLDAVVTMEKTGSGSVQVKLNKSLAAGYLEVLTELEKMGLQQDISTATLASFPDVVTVEGEEEDMNELWPDLEKALLLALNNLNASREEEGGDLASDLVDRLENIKGVVKEIEARSSHVVEEYHKRTRERVEKFLEGQEIDKERMLAEVAIFAEKSCITEELVRLKSHTESFARTINQNEPVGRKLDFILQEINRETNTIAAKANDYDNARRVVDIKSEVEKIREQVQNIE